MVDVVNVSRAATGGSTIPASELGTGTPTGTKFLRDDGSWQVPPGGQGAFAITEVEVDLSYPPIRTKTFTIVDAAVSTGSKIMASQSGNAPTGKNADDNEMDPFMCSATPGNGQFTLILSGIEGRIAGPFKVLYTLA